MKDMLAVMLFLHIVPYIRGNCFPTLTSPECSKGNLNKMGINCTELDWSEFAQCSSLENLSLSNNNISQIEVKAGANFKNLRYLDLSFNKLRHLPQDFLFQAEALLELSLANNQLLDLPGNFFNFSTKLQTLNLEGNPITAVPPTIINTKLANLTVDCRCDVIQSVMERFSQALPNGTVGDPSNEVFKCKLTNGWLDIRNYYTDHCKSSGLLAVYICVPLLVVAILAGVAIYVVQKKRKAADFPSKANSDMSPTHTQPRYMTRNMENHSNNHDSKMPSQTKAYENVFVGPLHNSPGSPGGQYDCLDRAQDPSSHAVEEDYYMQSDADQPVYGNAEQMYYNYSAAQNPTDEDVYIMPDT